MNFTIIKYWNTNLQVGSFDILYNRVLVWISNNEFCNCTFCSSTISIWPELHYIFKINIFIKWHEFGCAQLILIFTGACFEYDRDSQYYIYLYNIFRNKYACCSDFFFESICMNFCKKLRLQLRLYLFSLTWIWRCFTALIFQISTN